MIYLKAAFATIATIVGIPVFFLSFLFICKTINEWVTKNYDLAISIFAGLLLIVLILSLFVRWVMFFLDRADNESDGGL